MIIGRNSGVRPTASASANSSDSKRVVVQQGADQEHEQHQADDGAHDDQAEAARAALVLGRRRLLHQRVGDRAELRAGASRGHQRLAHAAHDRCAGEQLAVRAVADVFLHRQRLAGQRRLVDAERDCREQGRVGWQQVAGPKLEQIAGHHLAHRDFRELSVAPDAGGQGDQALESARRLLGVEDLEEVEGDAQQNDGDDDGRVERLADDARDDAGDQQDQDQRIREQAQTRPQQTEVAAGLD